MQDQILRPKRVLMKKLLLFSLLLAILAISTTTAACTCGRFILQQKIDFLNTAPLGDIRVRGSGSSYVDTSAVRWFLVGRNGVFVQVYSVKGGPYWRVNFEEAKKIVHLH